MRIGDWSSDVCSSDLVEPWRLQLLVQRATGALSKVFVSFDLPYSIPARYTTGGEATGRGQPADEAAAPPLWKRIWRSKTVSIGVLVGMLGVLTLIFFFQDRSEERRVGKKWVSTG